MPTPSHIPSLPDAEVEPSVPTVSPPMGPASAQPAPNGAALPRERRVSLRTAAGVAQIALAIMGTVVLLFYGRSVLIPITAAIMTSMALKPLVAWLHRRGIPNLIGSAAVVTALMAGVTCIMLYIAPPAMEWLEEAPAQVNLVRYRLANLVKGAEKLSAAANAVEQLGSSAASEKAVPVMEVKNSAGATRLFGWTKGAAAGLIETLALLFLILSAGDLFQHKLVRVIPRLRDKKRAVEITREIQQSISSYLFTVSVVNLFLGFLVAAVLFFLRFPNPFMWGAIVGVLNFIPYFGPVVGATGLALAGVLASEGLAHAILPAGIYILIHLVEANVVTPAVLGHRFTMNPVIIFVALITAFALWGIVGGFLAVPMLVALKIICDRVGSLQPLSEFLAK